MLILNIQYNKKIQEVKFLSINLSDNFVIK